MWTCLAWNLGVYMHSLKWRTRASQCLYSITTVREVLSHYWIFFRGEHSSIEQISLVPLLRSLCVLRSFFESPMWCTLSTLFWSAKYCFQQHICIASRSEPVQLRQSVSNKRSETCKLPRTDSKGPEPLASLPLRSALNFQDSLNCQFVRLFIAIEHILRLQTWLLSFTENDQSCWQHLCVLNLMLDMHRICSTWPWLSNSDM